MFRDSQARSIIKAISWRILGTLDTILLSYLILGDISLALSIGFTEVVTKLLLYYVHERVWNLFHWGRKAVAPSHKRSIAKSISWRVTGTIDTVIIAFLFSQSPESAFSIGFFELFTKILFFYLHERLWALAKWGRIYEE